MGSAAPAALLCLVGLVSACNQAANTGQAQTDLGAGADQAVPVAYTEDREACADRRPERRALFGDLHVHTAYSYDAAALSLETYPAEAYRFARGEAIPFFPLNEAGEPIGSVAIREPLDFVAVTDHAEFLGERELCTRPDSPKYDGTFCVNYRAEQRQGMLMLGVLGTLEEPQRYPDLCGDDGALCREWSRGPWESIIEAAEEVYDRTSACAFTSFIGFEHTGTPGLSNTHRNVVFRNSAVPDLPISYIEAQTDMELWEMLGAACPASDGCDWISIPHNSNLSNGRMFAPLGGHDHVHPLEEALDDETRLERQRSHALARQANEPIIEVFQHKGASECMNGLSNIFGEPDELCEVEALRQFGKTGVRDLFRIQDGEIYSEGREQSTTTECGDEDAFIGNGMIASGCVHDTDFYRSNLLVGLQDEQRIGVNSAKLGVIASTDTHVTTPGAVDEANYQGHVTGELTPEQRLQEGLLPTGIDGNPGGLAGVWAIENSRDAIFDAIRRREVFGTSGPRIAPRFFGGWSYADTSCDAPNTAATGYADGVPMGADLPSRPFLNRGAPTFIASADRDPTHTSAPLQKLQVIKGWIDAEGRAHNTVYDVAGDPESDASVDLETGSSVGAGYEHLCAVFEDPDFDPREPAVYYMRAVENPSARWSLYDCLSIDENERPDVCSDGDRSHVIQEMAWTSPIWYRPSP